MYRARPAGSDADVALKILPAHLASEEMRRRFAREISIASDLKHPNIVPVIEAGEAMGQPYYTMPLVEGITLAQRLARDGALPIEVAVEIACDVAAALACAHARGEPIVHRDIKPSNIMLTAAGAVVLDFGVARAISTLPPDSIATPSGVFVGTAMYGAPEQAGSPRAADTRADVYSLGCVTYEMLAGTPPFTGPDNAAIVRRHASDPVPPITTIRPAVPPDLEAVVLRALEKVPADRWQTAARYADALRAAMGGARVTVRPAARRRSRMPAALATAGVAVVAAAVWFAVRPPDLDADAYVVAPFVGDAKPAVDADGQFRSSLSSFTGVRLDALPPGSGAATVAELEQAARRRARTQHAAHFVLGETSRSRDSVQARVRVFSTGDDRAAPVVASVTFPDTPDAGAAALADLADAVLFGDAPAAVRSRARDTRLLSARRAAVRGLTAVLRWQLAAADTAFSAALRLDAEYAAAHLWLATVRWWSREPPARWKSNVTQAVAGAARMSDADRRTATALARIADQNYPGACRDLGALALEEPGWFAHWYSAAICVRSDSFVVRDSRSPSGWRFRASYEEAIRRFTRAYRLNPGILKAEEQSAFFSAQRVFFTTARNLRGGRAVPPDTSRFVASAAWGADSLVFVPWIPADYATRRLDSVAVTTALLRQRERFADIVAAWAATSPSDARAISGIAVARDLLGDASSIDTAQRARGLARSPDEWADIAATELWLRVKYRLLVDSAEAVRVVALADSILALPLHPIPGSNSGLDGVAALRGKPLRAADLAVSGRLALPPASPLKVVGPRLLAFSAMGAPGDSIRSLEQAVEDAVSTYLPPNERRGAIVEWVERAAGLAAPVAVSPRLAGRRTSPIPFVAAVSAFATGDTASARSQLKAVQAVRRFLPAENRTIDGVYPEAWLLTALGSPRDAAAWMDDLLTRFQRTPVFSIADAVSAACFVRMLSLRADVAARLGDRATAARYARLVTTLWTGSDASLADVTGRMRAIESAASARRP